jgi:hypothetical protein
MMDAAKAASVLTLRDPESRDFVLSHSRRKSRSGPSPALETPSDHSLRRIFDAVLLGNRDGIGALVRQALEEGRSAPQVNETA